LTNRRRGLQQA